MELNKLSIFEFDKVIYEHCSSIYKLQLEKRDKLENKTNFLMSFMVVILGFIVLNFNNIWKFSDGLAKKVKYPNTSLFYFILLSIPLMLISFSLFSIFMAVKTRSYKEEYPKNLVKNYFDDSSGYFDDGVFIKGDKKETVYKALSYQIAIAIDINGELNQKKSKWIKVAWLSIIITMVYIAISVLILFFI